MFIVGFGFAAALAGDRSFMEIHRAHALSIPPGVWKKNALRVGALDQVVIAHEVLFAGHGLVVAQEIDGVHVPVVEMPAAVVERLGNAMSERPSRRRLKARRTPQRRQGDGVVAAGVVAVNVEDLHRIEQLVVVAPGMMAILNFLEPQRKGFLGVRHGRRGGRGNDLRDVAKIVAPIGKPRIDDVGLAHIFHAHRPVGLPFLEQGPFARNAASHRRAAIPSVHGPL
jgi:hypothetical protein